MYESNSIALPTLSEGLLVTNGVPDQRGASEHLWIEDADASVILGMVLVGFLAVGLGAYIAFVIRVTYRENRRAKRLADIIKNMPITFSNESQTIRGVDPVFTSPSYHDTAYNAADNRAYHDDNSDVYDYNEKF